MSRPKGIKNKKTLEKMLPLPDVSNGMHHIVFFSGGLGSFFAAKRLVDSGVPRTNIILLFNDTKIEHPSLYKFLAQASDYFGIPITDYSDGRDIWQVFKDGRYLANSRVDLCSHVLKRNMARKFVERYVPTQTILYFGFDWTEQHRHERASNLWAPYQVRSFMCEAPYLEKRDMILSLAKLGIALPELYRLGFSHNNCGGGCVKAGIGHFAHLLDELPEVFTQWENKEKEISEYIGKPVTYLRRMVNGVRYPYSLSMLRANRSQLCQLELFDIGGCGCFQD